MFDGLQVSRAQVTALNSALPLRGVQVLKTNIKESYDSMSRWKRVYERNDYQLIVCLQLNISYKLKAHKNWSFAYHQSFTIKWWYGCSPLFCCPHTMASNNMTANEKIIALQVVAENEHIFCPTHQHITHTD